MALAGDGGDEWWIECAEEAAHFGEGEFEGGGHVLAGNVAGGENEFANGVLLEGAFFKEVVADAFVCGEQSPAIRADEREPHLIGSSSFEVSEMSLEVDSERGECGEDRGRIAEIFVEVEDEIVKLRGGERRSAPSGVLLRFAAACSHILRRDWSQIPGR